ncbi:pirin family protein, partial [Candidatus Entotheonella palauensis]|uniref:pirin family protein n=1 Tax=Candidatus Entotheonella palauensis TaxID=93172 RepID=UPI0011787390
GYTTRVSKPGFFSWITVVVDPRVFGESANAQTWAGIGHLVYLADARYLPKGETGLHGHQEIDVISVMVEGQVSHEGSLEHGRGLQAFDVQVQRAGGEGFSHNEINPDDHENRMIQLWVLPETAGQPAGYKVYEPQSGGPTRVYGGDDSHTETFASQTVIDVVMLDPGQRLMIDRPCLAYVTRGRGVANSATVSDGDLIRDDQLTFEADAEAQLIVMSTLA